MKAAVRRLGCAWLLAVAGCRSEPPGSSLVEPEPAPLRGSTRPTVMPPAESPPLRIDPLAPAVARVLTRRDPVTDLDLPRARLAHFRDVRWTIDGAAIGQLDGPLLSPPPLVVVVEDGNPARVALRHGSFGLLAYVPRDALAPVVTRPVLLHDRPETPRRGLQVELGRGEPVIVHERDGAWARVTSVSDASFSGWIPAVAIGETFVGPAFDPAAPAVLRPSTRLTATPGGREGFSVPEGATVELVEGPTRSKNRRARSVAVRPTCDGTIRRLGFVDSAHIEPLGPLAGCPAPEPWTGGLGMCTQLDGKCASLRTVPKGRMLLAPASTTVVGCAIEAAREPVDDAGRIHVHTAWGRAPVELAPAHAGACGGAF